MQTHITKGDDMKIKVTEEVNSCPEICALFDLALTTWRGRKHHSSVPNDITVKIEFDEEAGKLLCHVEVES